MRTTCFARLTQLDRIGRQKLLGTYLARVQISNSEINVIVPTDLKATRADLTRPWPRAGRVGHCTAPMTIKVLPRGWYADTRPYCPACYRDPPAAMECSLAQVLPRS